MLYIIDANNLAGKLEILFTEGFDKKMVAIMKKYFQGKGVDVKLVFDSNENMGDKFQEDNVEVVYTPRDRYYKNADDKVLELAQKAIKSGIGNDQLVVVTDDLDLSASVKAFAEDVSYRIKLVKSMDFVEKIKMKENQENYDETDRGLSREEENKINEELFNLWQ